jgi:hypothetical protein
MTKNDRYLLLALLVITNWALMALVFQITPVNLDFNAFYAAGKAALSNPKHVYDPGVQFGAAHLWKHPYKLVPFYHLPDELIVFVPLSLMPYKISLLLWRTLAAIFFLGATYLLSRATNAEFWPLLLKFSAFCPFIYCIGIGQDSTLLLLILSTALLLLKSDRPFLAGFVLALAIFKPQVPGMIALALLMSANWRAVIGFVSCAAMKFFLAFLVLGPSWMSDLLHLIRLNEQIEDATRMLSLHGLFDSFGIGGTPSLVVSAALVIAMCWTWHKHRDANYLFASSILVGGLCAVHFHVYDATVALIPIAVLISSRALRRFEIAYLVPLFVVPVFMLIALVSFNILALAMIGLLHSVVELGMSKPSKVAPLSVDDAVCNS